MEPHSHQNGSAQTGPVVANNEEGEQRPLWAGAERFTKIKKPFLWKEVAKEYFLSFVPHSVFWVPKYQPKQLLLWDAIAGLTCGVMTIPQGMAYGVLAGIEPQYGLLTALVPSLIYCIFGASPHIIIGPTAIAGLLTNNYLKAHPDIEPLQGAVLLTFLSGLFLILLSFVRAGFLARLISKPVLVGFTSAAALLISMSQVKYVFGIKMDSSYNIIDFFKSFAPAIAGINWWSVSTLLMFFAAFAILVGLKQASARFRVVKWIPGPLVVVILGTLISWLAKLNERIELKVVGYIPSGLPPPIVPVQNFSQVTEAAPFVVFIALITFVEHISVGMSLASKVGLLLDADKELWSLGLAQFVGSFFSIFPPSGSFTRSAVNFDAGGKSPLAGLVQAAIVLIVVLLLTPTLFHLPYCILAAIVFSGCISLFEWKEAVWMWKTRRRDFIVCIGTFIATLLVGVDSGIILGVVLNLLMFMVSLAWVNIDEVGRDDNARVYEEQYVPLRNNADATTWRGVSIIKVEDSLCFINVDVVTQTIEKIGHDTANRDGLETAESLFPKSPEELAAVYGEENDPLPTDGEESSIDRALRVRTTKELTKYIILDLSKVNYIDSSALYRLKNFHGELKSSEDVELFFACLQGSVYRALAKAGVVEKVGERHFFLSIEDALASIPEIRDRRMTIPKQATYSATEPRNIIHDV